MEQRSSSLRDSSLQKRLEARRNMFMTGKTGDTEARPKPLPMAKVQPASLSRSGSGASNISFASTTSIQSNVPPIAAVTGAPRNMRDALNMLNQSKEDTSRGLNSSSPLNSTERNNDIEKINYNLYTKPSKNYIMCIDEVCSNESSSEYENKINHPISSAGPNKPLPASSREGSEIRNTYPSHISEAPITVKKLKTLEGYVGFANLPNQVYRKAVKKGFEFTLMVVGESGLGKSTLINSMFLTDVYSQQVPGPSARVKKTVQVETNKALLKESGVNLTLTTVDTPGFGDAVDNSNCWDPVISYVESQYEAFLDAETRVNRITAMPDTRVHACLYFIAPSGHGLKPLDVEFMKRLHDKVNIIPVIGKADTLTSEEIALFKNQIMNQITQSKIKIYEFPDDIGCSSVSNGGSNPEDEKERRENRKLKERVPFAVVGSNTLIESPDGGEKKIRGRRYPWGVVDIENMEHCDFVPLRNMLIRTHLQDLKEVTNNVHYENYRCRKLAGVAGGTVEKIPNKNPLAQIEEERKEHQTKMAKMEREMEEVFERKVREKRQKLADSQADLEKRHKESKDKLEAQKRELEAKMSAFEQEKDAWQQMNNITVDELKRMSMESLDGKSKKKGGTMTSRVKLAFSSN